MENVTLNVESDELLNGEGGGERRGGEGRGGEGVGGGGEGGERRESVGALVEER